MYTKYIAHRRPNIFGLLFIFLCITSSYSCCDEPTEYYTAADYKSTPKIDAHFHYKSDNTCFLDFAQNDNFKLLSPDPDPGSINILNNNSAITNKIYHKRPKQFSYFTTFCAADFEKPDFTKKTISHIEKEISSGAAGVKIWKNIGMSIQDKNGNYILPDHPAFDTIYNYLERNNIPLMAHIGEPRDCWLPVEKMEAPNNANYYKHHPQYHMFLHPEMPSYEKQISARNNILKKHPGLHFIGAHLASEEWNIEKLEKTMNEFPRMKIDLSGRILNLQVQSIKNYDKVRNFIINYADRILYGTDYGVNMKDSTKNDQYKWIKEQWEKDWLYYATDSVFESSDLNCAVKGLHLPKKVIDKIYYNNAILYFNQ
ncbi:MAG: amidohydrolase family protein [Bacteroidales bacterium]|nr:amidohydrolase family protein [Bacteroidales bacterium]